MSTLSQTWMLWATLLAMVAASLWAERLRLGARASAVVIALSLAMLAANIGLIPKRSDVYDIIRVYLVPLAIPMLILKADLLHGWRDLALVAGAMLLNMAAATVSIVLVAALLPEANISWATTTLAGSIGGQSTGAVQSLLLALFLMLLFILPSIRALRQWFNEPLDDRWGSTVQILLTEHRKGNRLYLPSISLTLALSAVICTAAFTLASRLGMAGTELLLIASFSLALSLVLPRRVVHMSGAEDLGILIMLLLFIVIGAAADFGAIRAQPGTLAMTSLALLLQLVILLVAGKYLRLSLPQLVIATNAGIGGATSATAMAAARRWHTLLFPAVLYASIGQWLAQPLTDLLAKLIR